MEFNCVHVLIQIKYCTFVWALFPTLCRSQQYYIYFVVFVVGRERTLRTIARLSSFVLRPITVITLLGWCLFWRISTCFEIRRESKSLLWDTHCRIYVWHAIYYEVGKHSFSVCMCTWINKEELYKVSVLGQNCLQLYIYIWSQTASIS